MTLKDDAMNEEKQELEDDVIVPTMLNGLLGVKTSDLAGLDKANTTTTNMEDSNEGNEVGKIGGRVLGLNYCKALFPTTYDIIFGICFPLVLMIAVACFFGYFIALSEGPTEQKSNKEEIIHAVDEYYNGVAVIPRVTLAYETCLTKYSSEENNAMNLTDFIKNCTSSDIEKASDAVTDYFDIIIHSRIIGLTEDWSKCNYTKRLLSYTAIRGKYFYEGDDLAASQEYAKVEANIDDECSVNAAGGAWFWFTVMTTIGYGNAVPTSYGARAMLYTFGLFSILAFTASIGHAAVVMLAIVDKIYNSHKKLRPLQHGFPAVLVWCVALLVWFIVTAAIQLAYVNDQIDRIPEYPVIEKLHVTLPQTLWWTYASMTTVGFGDIFKPQSLIDWGEVFLFGPILMIGFVLLGNFLIKLSDVLIKHFRSATKYLPSLEKEIDEGSKGGKLDASTC